MLRGIPFSHEDKIHELIQESLLLGRRTKGNFACCFRSFLQVFEMGFLQKISYFDGKERPIKAGKITEPNLTYRGYNKTVFNIIALIFRKQDFLKFRAFLLTHLVDPSRVLPSGCKQLQSADNKQKLWFSTMKTVNPRTVLVI